MCNCNSVVEIYNDCMCVRYPQPTNDCFLCKGSTVLLTETGNNIKQLIITTLKEKGLLNE